MNSSKYYEIEETILDCVTNDNLIFARGFDSVFQIEKDSGIFTLIEHLNDDLKMGQKEIFNLTDSFITYSDSGKGKPCVFYLFSYKSELLWKNQFNIHPFEKGIVEVNDSIYILGILTTSNKFGLAVISKAGDIQNEIELPFLCDRIVVSNQEIFIAGENGILKINPTEINNHQLFEEQNIIWLGTIKNDIIYATYQSTENSLYVKNITSDFKIKSCVAYETNSKEFHIQTFAESDSIICSFGTNNGITLLVANTGDIVWNIGKSEFTGKKFLQFLNKLIIHTKDNTNTDIIIIADVSEGEILKTIDTTVFIEDIFLSGKDLIVAGLGEYEIFNLTAI